MGTRARLLAAMKELPPVRAYRVARFERAFARSTPVALHRGVYRSFAEAVADAPRSMPSSYDNEAAAAMYGERLSRVYPSDYPVLFWMNAIWPDVRRVFDFGGHVGIGFYAYEKYLRYTADLRWTVLDVPSVIERGRRLAIERGEKRLSFTRDLESADGVDLLLAAGSLQFVEEPLHSILSRLRRRPRHVIVNRTPMYDGEAFVTLHNNGTSICPYNVFNRRDFIGSMGHLGYELVDTWDNCDPGVSCWVAFRPERSVSQYTGIYLRLSPSELS
ncbi:MAG: TIGR04325 family methyltransferase [Polyangiaceae bacterium]|jgi:putative methyltransferase (TIGR04325 family)